MLRILVVTLLRRLHQAQRGQVLVLVAGLLAVFGGVTAVAIDLGSYTADRRDQQNSADAIALAASQELPNEDDALVAANEWALKNDIDTGGMTVEVIPQSATEPNPKVRVTVESDHSFTFARLIGINSATVSATAAAIKTSPAGGAGMVPLSITQDALTGVALGDEVVLKYDANDIDQGNTSPIRIDGPGGGNCEFNNQFCTGVKFGSETTICAAGTDTTFCSGPTTADTQPGNLIGNISEAIQYRLDNTDLQCDEFDEVFEDDPDSAELGTYRIVQECNPFLAGSYSSLRILIVPVIEELCSPPEGGACEITIIDFALVFLEGFGSGGCIGVDCEIVGRFVRVNQNVGLLAGSFDPTAFNHFVRLVE